MQARQMRILKSIVPAALRHRLQPYRHRFLYYRHGLTDVVDRLRGRREEMVPPRRLIFMVGGGFKTVGASVLGHLIDPGGLRPDDRVLDVGCGVGRIAVPLTGYLSSRGSYEGFDSWRSGVRWCQKNVTPRFPAFRFQVADLYNEFYTPRGRFKASEYRFPYPDASFDFVFLTSVFTHLLPEDLENYLSEVARVLRPGGRTLITYFLWGGEAAPNGAGSEPSLDFRFDFGRYRSINEHGKEAAIAYDERYIRELYASNGLVIQEPIVRGAWSGAANPTSFQDIVVATSSGTSSG